MHPYFTLVWLLKYVVATLVALVFIALDGTVFFTGIVFVSTIVILTILAHMLYAAIRWFKPALVFSWEMSHMQNSSPRRDVDAARAVSRLLKARARLLETMEGSDAAEKSCQDESDGVGCERKKEESG